MADFVIGSFNCCIGSADETPKPRRIKDNEFRNRTLANIIKDMKAQIMVLQEFRVKNKDLNTAKMNIQHRLGLSWDIKSFSMAPEANGDYSENQTEEHSEEGRKPVNDTGYAVLWDKNHFINVSYINDRFYHRKWKRIYETKIKSHFTNISRPPQIVFFQPKNLPKFELRIINTHIRCSKEDFKTNFISPTPMQGLRSPTEYPKKTTSETIEKRKNELTELLEIYSEVNDFSVNKSVYTMILGDFNLDFSDLSDCIEAYNKDLSFLKRIRGTSLSIAITDKTTLRKKYVESPAQYFNHAYDHFILNTSLLPERNSCAGRINTVCKYFSENNEDHYRRFSDHVPIRLELTMGNKLSKEALNAFFQQKD